MSSECRCDIAVQCSMRNRNEFLRPLTRNFHSTDPAVRNTASITSWPRYLQNCVIFLQRKLQITAFCPLSMIHNVPSGTDNARKSSKRTPGWWERCSWAEFRETRVERKFFCGKASAADHWPRGRRSSRTMARPNNCLRLEGCALH